MKIAITGANGFVGSRLTTILAREHDVRALSSRKTGVQPTDRFEYVYFDLTSEQAELNTVFDGCDVVIHLASKVHDMSKKQSADDYLSINVDGTRKLLKSAVKSDIKQFIFISTIKVHGEKTEQYESLTEESELKPLDPYSISKKHCEQLVISELENSKVSYTILRPPLIYGPGVKANFLKLITLISSGLPLPFESIQNCRSFIYVDNFCDAICKCINNKDAMNEVFLIRDYDFSTPELFVQISKALSIKQKLFPFPVSVLKLLAQITGKQNIMDRLAESMRINDHKFRSKINWEPLVQMETSMTETVRWYKSRS